MEDKEISKLEKLLHIKKGSKKLKQAFYDDGFDDLLDFCDPEKRKELIKKEGNQIISIDLIVKQAMSILNKELKTNLNILK